MPLVLPPISPEQQVRITANPTTPGGNPASLDGNIMGETTSGDGQIVAGNTPYEVVVFSDAEGESDFRVSGDADLGEGVERLEDTVHMVVGPARASFLGLTASAPENRIGAGGLSFNIEPRERGKKREKGEGEEEERAGAEGMTRGDIERAKRAAREQRTTPPPVSPGHDKERAEAELAYRSARRLLTHPQRAPQQLSDREAASAPAMARPVVPQAVSAQEIQRNVDEAERGRSQGELERMGETAANKGAPGALPGTPGATSRDTTREAAARPGAPGAAARPGNEDERNAPFEREEREGQPPGTPPKVQGPSGGGQTGRGPR
jgi:hypothetical protein